MLQGQVPGCLEELHARPVAPSSPGGGGGCPGQERGWGEEGVGQASTPHGSL